jgi:hypothetical protein
VTLLPGGQSNHTGIPEAAIAIQIANADKYQSPYFYVPPEAHRSKIRHFKTNVGSA